MRFLKVLFLGLFVRFGAIPKNCGSVSNTMAKRTSKDNSAKNMNENPAPSFEDLSREELIALVKELSAQKRKFGLVWEDKPEEVAELCATKLPVLNEVAKRHIKRVVSGKGRVASNSSLATRHSLLPDDGSNLPTHLIIEGDNYHALSVLNYTHAGKIDVIYIDPPYNSPITIGAFTMFDDDDYDPTEPFSQDEFVAHNNRELRNIDAGRNEWEDLRCPMCGSAVRSPANAPFARCRECGTEF